jgi:hypothetical protein
LADHYGKSEIKDKRLSVTFSYYRLGWAADFDERQRKNLLRKNSAPAHAQIHVSFQTNVYIPPITEAVLRSIFERIGDVADVVIKKFHMHKVILYQNNLCHLLIYVF